MTAMCRTHCMLTCSDYDAWIITQREYAEDTVFRSLVPATTHFSARRRTLYMFHNSPHVPSPLHVISLKDDLWDTLNQTLHSVDPRKIAINVGMSLAPGTWLTIRSIEIWPFPMASMRVKAPTSSLDSLPSTPLESCPVVLLV